MRNETTAALLGAVASELEQLDQWSLESIESCVRTAGAKTGMEGGKVIHPVRLAITGRTWGPGLFELMKAIGKERCVERLRQAAETDWLS